MTIEKQVINNRIKYDTINQVNGNIWIDANNYLHSGLIYGAYTSISNPPLGRNWRQYGVVRYGSGQASRSQWCLRADCICLCITSISYVCDILVHDLFFNCILCAAFGRNNNNNNCSQRWISSVGKINKYNGWVLDTRLQCRTEKNWNRTQTCGGQEEEFLDEESH